MFGNLRKIMERKIEIQKLKKRIMELEEAVEEGEEYRELSKLIFEEIQHPGAYSMSNMRHEIRDLFGRVHYQRKLLAQFLKAIMYRAENPEITIGYIEGRITSAGFLVGRNGEIALNGKILIPADD